MAGVSTGAAAALVATSVILTSAAQLLFRLAMQQPAFNAAEASTILSVAASLGAAELMALATGLALYVASMLIWIFALTRFPVSLAYPMLSMSYVIVYVAATQIPALHETASLFKMAGVAFVVLGVLVISIGERASSKA